MRSLLLPGFWGAIVAGCLLRFWKLTRVSLWYDELWTVVGSSDRPFVEMYREWILGDDHPPAFFVANFLWFKLVPPTEFWARVPHAVIATVTVIYVLAWTRRVLNRDERLMSAGLMALCSMNIHYALEVKQYSAMILLATVATVCYLEIVQSGRMGRRTGILFTASCVGIAHLNYFATVYAGLLLLLLAATFRDNRVVLRQIVRSGAVFGVCYLPVAYFLYLQLAYPGGTQPPTNAAAFVSDLLAAVFFDDRVFLRGALIVFAIALLTTVVLRPEVRATLGSRRNGHLLLIWIAMTGFMLALGAWKPIFFPRYFFITFPALLIGVGILAAATFPPRASWLAVLPLVFFARGAVIEFQAVDSLQRQEWDKSVALVLERRRPNDRVFVLGARADKTSFDYLRDGNIDGLFYVKNLKFYEYYFKRKGAPEVAASLEVLQPTVQSVRELAARFRGTGTTAYVLAGHHIEYSGEAWKALRQAATRVDVAVLYNALVYTVSFDARGANR